MKTIFVIFSLVIVGAISAQVKSVQPLVPCCENRQAEGLQADDWTGVNDIYNNCTHLNITARQCVDRTRDGQLCSEGGSRFCKETSSQYPRYYALWHPMIVSSSSMTFVATYGGGNPSSQTFSITNGVWQAFQDFDYTLDWNANKTQSWLTVSPSSGNVSGTTPVSATVSVNISGLARGTYSDAIGVHSNMVSSRQWETINVALNVADLLSASISGPTSLSCNQSGTWTASVSGGWQPYHYQWYYFIVCMNSPQIPNGNTKPLIPPCGYWLQNGSDSPSFSHSACSDFEVKCYVTDAFNRNVTTNIIYVTVSGSANVLASNPFADDAAPAVSPEENSLNQNYPNPFNPSTQIRFTLAKPSHVKLAVYDMLGREVARLADEEMDAGYHSVMWNADKVSSGVYIYRLSTNNFVQIRRMVVMK